MQGATLGKALIFPGFARVYPWETSFSSGFAGQKALRFHKFYKGVFLQKLNIHCFCKGVPLEREGSNADLNTNFNANGMLQKVSTPKVQRRWEAVSTPMGELRIPTPKGGCYIIAQKRPPLTKKCTFLRFQSRWQISTPRHSTTKVGIEGPLGCAGLAAGWASGQLSRESSD